MLGFFQRVLANLAEAEIRTSLKKKVNKPLTKEVKFLIALLIYSNLF